MRTDFNREDEDERSESILSLTDVFYLTLGHFGLDVALNLSMIIMKIIPGSILDLDDLDMSFRDFDDFINFYFPIHIRKRLYYEALVPGQLLIAHIDFMFKYRAKLDQKGKSLNKLLSTTIARRQFLQSACPEEEIKKEERYEMSIGATLDYNMEEEYTTIWSENCKTYNLVGWEKLARKFQQFCINQELPILIIFTIADSETGKDLMMWPDIKEDDSFVFEVVEDEEDED